MNQKISYENLEQVINEASHKLLEMLNEHVKNNVSNNFYYVINRPGKENSPTSNFFERNRIRKKLLNSKEILDLKDSVNNLKSFFNEIYLIELYLFKSERNRTIIEIEIMEKDALEEKYRESIKTNPPGLHCKVALPPYVKAGSAEIFDINWQLGSLKHKWKMFCWKMQKRKKY